MADHMDERAEKYGFVEEDIVRGYVARMLENVDAEVVVGKVFRGSINYLICATTCVIMLVCVLGRQNRLKWKNEIFWDLKNGTGIVDEWGNNTLNCSGVFFEVN